MSTSISTLVEQEQLLLQAAPTYGIPQPVMQVVVQMLSQVAQELDHTHYFVLRHPDQAWLTIGLKDQPWLPAFAYEQDAQVVMGTPPDLELVSLGILELLFLGLGLTHAQGLMFLTRRTRQTMAKP